MALWRSGLTHRPLKATFTGSNPVRVTTQKLLATNSFGNQYDMKKASFSFDNKVRSSVIIANCHIVSIWYGLKL